MDIIFPVGVVYIIATWYVRCCTIPVWKEGICHCIKNTVHKWENAWYGIYIIMSGKSAPVCMIAWLPVFAGKICGLLIVFLIFRFFRYFFFKRVGKVGWLRRNSSRSSLVRGVRGDGGRKQIYLQTTLWFFSTGWLRCLFFVSWWWWVVVV